MKEVKRPVKKVLRRTTVSQTDLKRYLELISNPSSCIDKDEILATMRAFDRSDLNYQAVLLSIDMTKSYEQFGCKDMKSFIESALKISYDKGYKIYRQAQIAYNAGGVNAVGKYTGNALNAMKGLEPEEQKRVLRHALKAHGGKITGTIIKASMVKLGYVDEISEQHKKTKDKISKIHGAIKGSTTRPELLQNFAQAMHDHLKVRDINLILKKLRKIQSEQ